MNLKNKVFCVTGRLPNMTRKQAHELLKSHGCIVSKSITKPTNYLLIGSKPSQSKIAEAKSRGKHVMQWDEFQYYSEPKKTSFRQRFKMALKFVFFPAASSGVQI